MNWGNFWCCLFGDKVPSSKSTCADWFGKVRKGMWKFSYVFSVKGTFIVLVFVIFSFFLELQKQQLNTQFYSTQKGF